MKEDPAGPHARLSFLLTFRNPMLESRAADDAQDDKQNADYLHADHLS